MDANKLKVLREIGYKITPACGRCIHRFFTSAQTDWGVCSIQTYDHEKHSESKRQLSIYKFGSCPKFQSDPSEGNMIAGFAEFLQVG